MPISSFGAGLQKVLMFLPGTYCTSLIRNHTLNGALTELAKTYPAEAVNGLKDSIDCNIYFFGSRVEVGTMMLIAVASVVLLLGVYVLLNALANRKEK